MDVECETCAAALAVRRPPAHAAPQPAPALVGAPASASASAAPVALRVMFATVGSRGDVQPFVVIASALRARGDTVCIVTHECFRPDVEAAGLAFRSLGSDPRSVMTSERYRKAFYEGSFKEQMAMMQEGFDIEVGNTSMWEAARDFQPTVIIGNVITVWAAWALAEFMHIPCMCFSPIPWLESDEYPVPGLTARPLWPSFLNRWAHRIVGRLYRSSLAPPTNKLRVEKLGLPPARSMDLRRVPMAVTCSALVTPRALRWPSTCEVIGYQIAPPPEQYSPPDSLRAFLDAGEPPVYVGFGSMPLRNTRDVAVLVLNACRALGLRVIMCACWGALTPADTAAGATDVLAIDDVPHEYVLPRCCAAVHHGGAGTTAASLRAGIPTIIFPLLADQPMWAGRVAALGVGPQRFVSLKQLTEPALVSALREALDPAVRARASALGARLRHEDPCGEHGVQTAVAFIDKHSAACAGPM